MLCRLRKVYISETRCHGHPSKIRLLSLVGPFVRQKQSTIRPVVPVRLKDVDVCSRCPRALVTFHVLEVNYSQQCIILQSSLLRCRFVHQRNNRLQHHQGRSFHATLHRSCAPFYGDVSVICLRGLLLAQEISSGPWRIVLSNEFLTPATTSTSLVLKFHAQTGPHRREISRSNAACSRSWYHQYM